jgi:hypothetical protein
VERYERTRAAWGRERACRRGMRGREIPVTEESGMRCGVVRGRQMWAADIRDVGVLGDADVGTLGFGNDGLDIHRKAPLTLRVDTTRPTTLSLSTRETCSPWPRRRLRISVRHRTTTRCSRWVGFRDVGVVHLHLLRLRFWLCLAVACSLSTSPSFCS